ncbi:MAG: very short patch repair endonuclease [Lentilitoribacter sp.]
MADIVSPKKRSSMMAGIGSKNTKPEIKLRKALHGAGFRYRLHIKSLPGKPDLVFPKYKAVIFVNGCFWHGHDCRLFKWPKTRSNFWRHKIEGNIARDKRTREELLAIGWRVMTIWECTLKGRDKIPQLQYVNEVSEWLRSDTNSLSIPDACVQGDKGGHRIAGDTKP